MASDKEVHLASSACLLCRQTQIAGTEILDLDQTLLLVQECTIPCARCSYKPYPRVWFHSSCYGILVDSYRPSEKPTREDLWAFADATRPSYTLYDQRNGQIASAMEGLFSRHTRIITQADFGQDLFMRLPMEIQVMISDFIAPCWYLTVLGETRRLLEQLRSNHEPQSIQFKLTHNVWMLKTCFRGAPYVARLSNKPLKATAYSPVYHMKVPDRIDKIVLSLDSIGIRGIQFVDDNSKPRPDGSPWYDILEPRAAGVEVKVHSEGLVLRSIELISDSPSSMRWLWGSPFPPKFHPWNFYNKRNDSRLDYIEFDGNMKGLLVCCANTKMVGIHGFSDTSTKFRDFVNLMHRRTRQSYKHWIYFPLNRQEHVTTAWIRKLKVCRRSASSAVLVLQTSLGRTVTFGPRFKTSSLDQFEHISLVKDSDGVISGVFHDGRSPVSNYVSEVGVTCSDTFRNSALDLLPVDTHLELPGVPPGRRSATGSWYMTETSLNGLAKVQFCRDWDQSHRPILGLLLVFDDEHIESLGQVRWECGMSEEILMPIYIQKGTHDGRDYIKDIRSGVHDQGFDTNTGEWQKLPNLGTVIWWFSELDDKVVILEKEEN